MTSATAEGIDVNPNDPAFQTPSVMMDPSSMGASDKLKAYLQAREEFKPTLTTIMAKAASMVTVKSACAWVALNFAAKGS